jgi:hypothetical protein
MVRFSDLLGGNDDADESRPAAVSTPIVTKPEPEPEEESETDDPAGGDTLAAFALDADPVAPIESPEDVLDRLTQYATSARAGDQMPETPAPVADPVADPVAEPATTAERVQEFQPVGDDLLPRAGSRKPSRGRKRRP